MEAPKTFEIAVALAYAAGATKREAVKKAMYDYPDLYTDYLKRLKAGGQDSINILIQAHDDGLRRQWATNPDLQREFRSPDVYIAYERARREGRIGRGTTGRR